MFSKRNSPTNAIKVAVVAALTSVLAISSCVPVNSADASKPAPKSGAADASKTAPKSGAADTSKTAPKSGAADTSKTAPKSGATDTSKSAIAGLKPKMGYKIVMKVNYFGRIEWSVSADGARLSSPMLAITCRPPQFETHLYNTETKKVKVFDKKAGFERIGAMMEGGITAHSRYKYSPWKMEGEDKVAGMKCTKYSRYMLNAQQDEHRYAKYIEEYWVAPFFDLPHIDDLMAPLARLTSREFSLKKGFGVKRIATWQVYRRGVAKPDVDDKIVFLQTLECKKTMIDPKIFELGANYTPVKDEGEILFSDDGGGFPGHL